MTKPLDTREADFVQFLFRYGCSSVPVLRDQGVTVEFTSSGGAKWRHLAEIYFTDHVDQVG